METFLLIHGLLKIEVMTIMGIFRIHESLPSPCSHPNEVDHLLAWKSIEKLLPNTYERHVPNKHMDHSTKRQVIYHSGHTISHAPMEACSAKRVGSSFTQGNISPMSLSSNLAPKNKKIFNIWDHD